MVGVNNVSALNETAGSVAYLSRKCNDCPTEKPCELGFRGADTFEGSKKKKSGSLLTTAVFLAGLGALAVGGLGYAHKTGAIAKLFPNTTKEWLKKSRDYLGVAAQKCYQWCSTVKSTGKKWIETVTGWFGKK